MPGAHNSRLDDSHSLNEYTFSTFFEPRLVLFDFFLFWLQKWECVWFNWQYQFVKWLRLIFLFLIEYLRNAIYDWLIFVKFNSKHHVYKKALITQAFELWNQIKFKLIWRTYENYVIVYFSVFVFSASLLCVTFTSNVLPLWSSFFLVLLFRFLIDLFPQFYIKMP